MTTGILVVLILGTVMAVIGFWSSKRNKSTDDYYVGGRSLGSLVTIATQCATFVGGGMTLGWIGMGAKYGFSSAWYGAPQSLGFFFMAAVLVKMMRKYNFTSLPDWFDSLYHNKALSIISALACLIVPITWVTAQTTAAARMLETVGVPYLMGVLVVGGIVIYFYLHCTVCCYQRWWCGSSIGKYSRVYEEHRTGGRNAGIHHLPMDRCWSGIRYGTPVQLSENFLSKE